MADARHPEILRIGCGAGFWGDSPAGAAQLVRSGAIDVLMLDYLAEITMSLLARAREKRSTLGYAGDFVSAVMAPLARDIADKGIKVITNAGGVNPLACRDAVQAVLEEQGIRLTIAVVEGDDITSELETLRNAGVQDLETSKALPSKTISANAYLGAFPIADALRRGADIVITGRCADSALALGPLIAAFDWKPADLDLLAMGSLAGHIIECGAQATGGVFTDWRDVVEGWDDMGFPIVECQADGNFVVTKPANTGGAATVATVAEQIVYEIHDPAAYVLPDVICDFTQVRLTSLGKDRVSVRGARGLPPTETYKASLTYHDGYRCIATLMIVGPEAVERSERVAAAILRRTRRLMAEQGFADFRATSVEVLGSEGMYGAHARSAANREVVMKLAVTHEDRNALETFSREVIPSATSMAQSITGFASGRPTVQPLVRLASCLIPKSRVMIEVEMAGKRWISSPPATGFSEIPSPVTHDEPHIATVENGVAVPLLRLAYGRSGDKGDSANIGVLARRPEFLPVLRSSLTAAAVADWFRHLVVGEVVRYDWPGLNGFNFVLRHALGGGGASSIRYDPQGKSYAQILMDIPIHVPAAWCEAGGLLT